MKKKSILLAFIVLIVFFYTACENGTAPPGSNTLTDITIEVTTISNGNSVEGVSLTYNGETVVTDVDGNYSITIEPDQISGELPASVTIEASKKFFVDNSKTFTLSEYAGQSTVSEEIEISPRIFIPDMMGNSGVGRIVAIDDMNGTNRVDVSEIPGYIDSGAEVDENENELGKLDGPTAITVDYDTGVIYIFDSESYGGEIYSNDRAYLIRLTDFPETASDSLDASDVQIFELEYAGGDASIRSVHQAVITGADELLVLSGQEYSDSFIHKISGMAGGTITIEESAANQYEGVPGSMASGLAVFSDGQLIVLADTPNDPEEVLLLDSFGDDQIPDSLVLSENPSVGDTDYFALALRLLLDSTGRWLYSGDSYNQHWAEDAPEMDRIARFDMESESANFNRENFGSAGSGTNQFDEPLLMAVLPDNRLYVQDVANQRLVRIDWSGTGIASGWTEYKPDDDQSTADVDESFGFDYFYFIELQI